MCLSMSLCLCVLYVLGVWVLFGSLRYFVWIKLCCWFTSNLLKYVVCVLLFQHIRLISHLHFNWLFIYHSFTFMFLSLFHVPFVVVVKFHCTLNIHVFVCIVILFRYLLWLLICLVFTEWQQKLCYTSLDCNA